LDQWPDVLSLIVRTDVTYRPWFAWWALLPVLLLACVAFYCSPLAFNRRWAFVVFAILLVMAVCSLLLRMDIPALSLVAACAFAALWAWRLPRDGSLAREIADN